METKEEKATEVRKKLSIKNEWMELRELKLLDRNARFMKPETYAQLVENLKHDGELSSVPFAVKEPDGSFTVLSGNHRVMAAVDAGITHGFVMFTEEKLNPDERKAIQLSHNALVGEDDISILADIYNAIRDIGARKRAGLSDEQLDLIRAVRAEPFSSPQLFEKTVVIRFLPEEIDKAKQEFELIRASSLYDEAWLAHRREYDTLLDELEEVNASFDVVNIATAFMIILDIFKKHKLDLKEGWWDEERGRFKHKKRVPLSSVFDDDKVPSPVARKIERAIESTKKKLPTEKQHITPLEVLALWAEQNGGGG